MTVSRRRVLAIVAKELREFSRNRSVVMTMSILPLIFIIQPLIAVVGLGEEASGTLRQEHVLLYLLGIPALVPVLVAGYAVSGERQQGTLEPVLTTPIRREEFLLGKAVAAFLPSVVIAYVVFAIFLGLVSALAEPSVAAAFIQGPDLLAQILYTPLLAAWSIWVGIAISTRVTDVRAAQQLGILASLPSVLVIVLVALNIVTPTLGLAVVAAALLIGLDVAGWRLASRLFDRERLITGTR